MFFNEKEIIQSLLERKRGTPASLPQLRNQIFNWVMQKYMKRSQLPNPLYKLAKQYLVDWININIGKSVTGGKVVRIIIDYEFFYKINPGNDKDITDTLKKFIVKFEKEALKNTKFTIATIGRQPITTTLDIELETYHKPVTKPHYLYHATSLENSYKILKQGIKPKTRKIGKPGYYFYSKPKVFLSDSFMGAKMAYMNDYSGKTPVLLSIDTTKFKQFNLYRDPTEDEAFYTFSHIPAKALSVESKAKSTRNDLPRAFFVYGEDSSE